MLAASYGSNRDGMGVGTNHEQPPRLHRTNLIAALYHFYFLYALHNSTLAGLLAIKAPKLQRS